MSINPNCLNRIKPKLLREVKTEALLVFIRTTLEQYFKDLDKNKINFQMGSPEDREVLHQSLESLLNNLQDTVVNSTYIRSIIAVSHKSQTMQLIAQKEKPLMI